MVDGFWNCKILVFKRQLIIFPFSIRKVYLLEIFNDRKRGSRCFILHITSSNLKFLKTIWLITHVSWTNSIFYYGSSTHNHIGVSRRPMWQILLNSTQSLPTGIKSLNRLCETGNWQSCPSIFGVSLNEVLFKCLQCRSNFCCYGILLLKL